MRMRHNHCYFTLSVILKKLLLDSLNLQAEWKNSCFTTALRLKKKQPDESDTIDRTQHQPSTKTQAEEYLRSCGANVLWSHGYWTDTECGQNFRAQLCSNVSPLQWPKNLLRHIRRKAIDSAGKRTEYTHPEKKSHRLPLVSNHSDRAAQGSSHLPSPGFTTHSWGFWTAGLLAWLLSCLPSVLKDLPSISSAQ